MFGYVTVCEPELKIKDFRKYRSYYCGLCQTLKEKYGFYEQMTLTYDMTFAILLLTSLYECESRIEQHRCKVHLVKKQTMRRNEMTEYAADMNLLLAYYHLEDDWADEKKAAAFLGKPVLLVRNIRAKVGSSKKHCGRSVNVKRRIVLIWTGFPDILAG